VRLTLVVPQDAYNLVVEDYIPAGAEILDTSLKSSQQGTPQPQYDPAQPFSAGWGWWLFQPPQIYDDHIAWAASYLPAGTYALTYNIVMLQAGQYRVLPAHAMLFYFPEVQGNSAGTVFEIKPASTH
jgi:alpha-2-macroglobulin